MAGIYESEGRYSTGFIGEPFSEEGENLGGNYIDPLFSERFLYDISKDKDFKMALYEDFVTPHFLKIENPEVWKSQQELWRQGTVLPPIVEGLPPQIRILDIGAGGFANSFILKKYFEKFGIDASFEGIELDKEIIRMVKEGEFEYSVDRYILNDAYKKFVEELTEELFIRKEIPRSELFEEEEYKPRYKYVMKEDYRRALNLKQGDITSDYLDTDLDKYDIVMLVGVIRNIGEDLDNEVKSKEIKDRAFKNSLDKVKEGGLLITNDQIYQVFNDEKKIVMKYGYSPQYKFMSNSPFGVMKKMYGLTEDHNSHIPKDYTRLVEGGETF